MRKLIVFLLFACCAMFGQQTNSDIIPATPGLNLGRSNQRWNAYLTNLDINGTCTVDGLPCLGGGGSGSGIMITTVVGLATVPGKINGTIAVVTNGLTSSDCTVGGGTANVACQFNGTTWSQLTAASSGGTTFAAITGGINVAALQIGTGGSLAPTGSGTITASNVPVDTTSTANNFFTAYTAATGVYTKARPTCGNLSDSTALCTTAPGTGVATFLTTPSSANLLAALTTKTGTGNAVFGTAPTISSAVLGTAAQLSYITGSTQCLHVDTTGAITGTGSDCGAGGGGGGLSGQTVLGFPIAATATTSNSSTVPGTNQGTYIPARINTSQGVATSPIELQVGDCTGAGTITGAGTTYTIAYSDVPCNVAHDSAGAAGATITIPTPTNLHNPAPIFTYSNYSAFTDTLSPTSFSISLGAAAPVGTLSVPPGFSCKVQLDPVNGSTWKADCHLITLTAGATSVNGSATPSPNFGNSPAAAAANVLGTWQVSGSNVSVEVPVATTPTLWLPFASTSVTQLPAGGVETGPGVNTVGCVQFVTPAVAITFTHLTVYVATTSAGQSLNVGILDASLNRIADSGAISTAAIGVQTSTIAAVTLQPSTVYYHCVAFTDTVAAVSGAGAFIPADLIGNKNFTRQFTCANALAAGALPATCGAQTPAASGLKRYLTLLE